MGSNPVPAPGLEPKVNTTVQKRVDKVLFFLGIANTTEERLPYQHSFQETAIVK